MLVLEEGWCVGTRGVMVYWCVVGTSTTRGVMMVLLCWY